MSDMRKDTDYLPARVCLTTVMHYELKGNTLTDALPPPDGAMASGSDDTAGITAASKRIAELGEDDANCIMVTLITFNFGIMQDMLNPGPWNRKHEQKFVQVMETFSEKYCADLVLGCEVGGHMQGMGEELRRNLPLPNIKTTLMQNYMTALNQKGVTTQLLRAPHVTQLAGTQALETQLVLTAVQASQGTRRAGITVIGNMYIRSPSAQHSPTIRTRLRLVREALGTLEAYGNTVLDTVPASERPGVVLLLVGDCNLDAELAGQAVDPSQHWVVKTTAAGLRGDLCFIKGCVANHIDVPVGYSYTERGMRPDNHDALGLILALPVVSKDVRPRKMLRSN